MNFLGMGPLEIVLIVLIGFIFLGPERLVDAARLMGKAVREARNFASEIPRVVVEDDDIKLVNAGKSTSLTGGLDPETGDQSADHQTEQDGPIPFRRDGAPTPTEARGEEPDTGSRK